MIIQRGSLRTKNKTCSKEYPLREYRKAADFQWLSLFLYPRREYKL